MKRILSLILASMLAFSLCGCGESAISNESEETEVTEEVIEVEEEEPVVYTYDMSTLPDVSELEASDALTDPFTFLDGTYVDNADDWARRVAEIKAMYQYYMYGIWRDGSDEELTYSLDGSTLTIYITRISTGATTSFTATVNMPDSSTKAPDGGYPVIVGMHSGISEDTATANGYAVITLDYYAYAIASDDTNHTGAFYDLYPYGDDWQEQTGVLMAWSWGCSKILDALEAGLGDELNISCENTAVTGVSRWGKAAIVCGVFETRFKLVMPSCSGAGGVALFRYTSEGKTYDFSTKGASSSYTYGQNEPLSSLQSSSERGWFCDRFLEFKSAEYLPFDQHLLLSTIASEDRYLFIIGSCIYEDWVNAPAMWYSYVAAEYVYDYLGLSDHIAINIHQQGHAVIAEDVEYMTDYFDYYVYGIEPELDLDDLKTSVFALDVNSDSSMDNFNKKWMDGLS